jgi:16S rRNA (guanine(1405)-N(7))-methyltransferase
MLKEDDNLETLVEAVLASSKYRGVSKDLIVSIGSQELRKRRNFKEALKASKSKLHQISGAYLDTRGREQYTTWLHELSRAAATGQREVLVQVCTKVMDYHASTRERLPILDQFYREIFSYLPPIRSIIDVACGFNPLALPWMSLAPQAEYYAYDIYQGMMDFLGAWMRLNQVSGKAEVRDVIQACPTHKVDVAFIFKAIPCLEQVDALAGFHLLQTLRADYLVVSFPVASMGGRNKGMVEHYTAHFRTLMANERWEITRLVFKSELVFIVKK